MTPALRLAVLVLPLAGLAAAWGWTHVRSQQGVEWQVPVSAYGPRASLRGRYLTFRYEWGLRGSADVAGAEALCLEGAPPRPVAARVTSAADASCRYLVRAVEGGARYSRLDRGILYIPQEQVPAIRRRLADRGLQPFVRIRVNDSGTITPLAIEFEPRSAPAR